tara:strand:- start:108 stop:2510 length:2403 start_codon:yes stop_codon:yes gene_type:complete
MGKRASIGIIIWALLVGSLTGCGSSDTQVVSTGEPIEPDPVPVDVIQTEPEEIPINDAEPLPTPVRMIVADKDIEAFDTSQIVADYLSSNQEYESVKTTRSLKCNWNYGEEWEEIPALTSIYFRQGFEADATQAMELLGTSSAEVKPWSSIPRDDIYNECWEPGDFSSLSLPRSGTVNAIEADLLVFVGQDIFSVTPPEITAGYCGYWTERKDISILHVNGTEIPSIDEIIERRFSEYNYLRSIDDDVPGYIIDTTVYYKEGCEIYATLVAELVRADDNSTINTEPFPDNPPFEISPDADIVVHLGTESGGTLGNAVWYSDDDEIERVCCSKFSPIWAPDGEHILFLEENEIETYNRFDDRYSTTTLSKVFMMNTDGGNVSDCLYVCDPDGSQEDSTPLWTWGTSIEFSPNGEYLALNAGRYLIREYESQTFLVQWDNTPEDESYMEFERIGDGPFTGDGLQIIRRNGSDCVDSGCIDSGFQLYIEHNRMNFGEDPSLDRIYGFCQKGDDYACKELSWYSADGSEYEIFGESCGGRNCDLGNLDDPDEYGGSAYLDDLYDVCATADEYACHELYLTAPWGSEYKVFGESCGGEINNDSNEILITNCDIFNKSIEPDRSMLGVRYLPRLQFCQSDCGDVKALVMSPDGNYFAGKATKIIDEEPNIRLLFVMSLDGSEMYQSAVSGNTFGESPIAFTSDGQQLIFRRSVRNPNGEFGTGTFAEGYGSDREFYAFRYDNEDLIMNIDGSNQRPLTEAEKLQYQDGISPDGTKVVFTDLVNGRDEIFVMDADGTNRKQLTFSLN